MSVGSRITRIKPFRKDNLLEQVKHLWQLGLFDAYFELFTCLLGVGWYFYVTPFLLTLSSTFLASLSLLTLAVSMLKIQHQRWFDFYTNFLFFFTSGTLLSAMSETSDLTTTKSDKLVLGFTNFALSHATVTSLFYFGNISKHLLVVFFNLFHLADAYTFVAVSAFSVVYSIYAKLTYVNSK